MEDKIWAVDSTSTTTKLLEKRRMMYEVKEEFNQAKDEEREHENDFKATESRIRAKDLELQQKLIQYNHELQDNEHRRNKALKKCEEEKKNREQREIFIKKLNQEYKELKDKNEALELEVSRMRKYEDYLERIKEKNSEDFPEIGDILMRYDTLIFSYENLMKRRHYLEEELQNIKKDRDQYEKKNKDDMMELTIEISKLQKDLEALEVDRNDLQKNLELASTLSTEKDLELGCMLTAIDSLYDRCLRGLENPKKKKIIHKAKTSAEDQDNYDIRAKLSVKSLNEIKVFIKDIEDVLGDYKEQKREKEKEEREKALKEKARA